MKGNPNMKIFITAVVGLSLFISAVGAVTCTGVDPCKACRSCKSCAHCKKGGGTCGVCKPSDKGEKAKPTK